MHRKTIRWGINKQSLHTLDNQKLKWVKAVRMAYDYGLSEAMSFVDTLPEREFDDLDELVSLKKALMNDGIEISIKQTTSHFS